MGRRLLLILLILAPSLALAADPPVTWEMAYSLKSRRPIRPKPIEPDSQRDNSGPFRLATAADPPADRPEPEPTMTPQVYELADASGQRWQHADPAFLSRFVAARNATTAYPFQVYRGTSSCPGGICPPR